MGNGKYFQSELINWEMAEELEDENKRIRLREPARGQKKYHYKPIDEEILSKSVLKLVRKMKIMLR